MKEMINEMIKEIIRTEQIRFEQGGGDENYLHNVPINDGDIVVEVGGFMGVYSEAISKRYLAKIFVLEPIKKYYDYLCLKFADNPRVTVLNYGLGKDGHFEFGLSDSGTGLFSKSEQKETVLLKSFKSFLTEHNLNKIDVMAINIEGGEYELLEQLLSTDFIHKIKRLYIQFHLIDSESVTKRHKLRELLRKHHSEIFCFPFIWEGWILNS